MTRKLTLATLIAFLLLSSAALAGGKGGKVGWNENPKRAMAMAKAQGLGMMLYFTSDG